MPFTDTRTAQIRMICARAAAREVYPVAANIRPSGAGYPVARAAPGDSVGCSGARGANSDWRPILDHVDLWDLFGEAVSWFADLLAPLGEHLVHRQAGHALARGRLGCSIKVMSGRQQGLAARGGGAGRW